MSTLNLIQANLKSQNIFLFIKQHTLIHTHFTNSIHWLLWIFFRFFFWENRIYNFVCFVCLSLYLSLPLFLSSVSSLFWNDCELEFRVKKVRKWKSFILACFFFGIRSVFFDLFALIFVLLSSISLSNANSFESKYSYYYLFFFAFDFSRDLSSSIVLILFVWYILFTMRTHFYHCCCYEENLSVWDPLFECI